MNRKLTASWAKLSPKSVFVFLFVFGTPLQLLAQVPAQFAKFTTTSVEQSSGVMGPSGGATKRVGDSQVETSIAVDGIRVRLWDTNQKPLQVGQSKGLAIIQVEGEARRYRIDLLPRNDYLLMAPKNLAHAVGKQLRLDIILAGLPRPRLPQSKIRFQDVLTLGMSSEEVQAQAIRRQAICPVTGNPLGSNGNPVAVHLGDRTVFVCCESCAKVAQSAPEEYSAGKPNIVVTTTTEADKAAIARQVNCPVMDEPLGKMGPVVKVLVGKQPIYLCCKGCVKKVRGEPHKYLAMLDAKAKLDQANVPLVGAATVSVKPGSAKNEVRPGVFEVSSEDQPFVVAQKRCPVMDEPLDAMGGPYKVNASGRVIYICCPGCAKKIAAEPAKYISKLSTQGINAPLFR